MTTSQFQSFQSQPHSHGMNVDASTSRVPGKNYGHFAQSTVDPQASEAIQCVYSAMLFPVLPTASSKTTDINTCRCSLNITGRTPSRTDLLHTVDLPSTTRTAHTTHTYVTFPAHASSVTVYGADPATSEAQIPTLRSSSTTHDCATWTIEMQAHPLVDTPTPPAALMAPGHPLIEPQLHEGEEETPALLSSLNPPNCLLDPWSAELAHTFPWGVRGALLTILLDDLEPLLDLPYA